MHTGRVEGGDRFLARAWPEVPAISDPDAALYREFSIGRGGPLALFGPAVWRRGWSAWWAGHRVGAPVGDPFRMSGIFAIVDRTVRWAHPYAHAGDHPDWTTLPEELAALPISPALKESRSA